MRARRTSKNLNFWQTVNYFVFSTTRPPSIFDFSFYALGSTDPRNNNNKQTIQFLLFKLYLKFRKTCCFYYLWHYVGQKSSLKSVYEKFYENNKQTSFSLFIFYGNLLLFAVFSSLCFESFNSGRRYYILARHTFTQQKKCKSFCCFFQLLDVWFSFVRSRRRS